MGAKKQKNKTKLLIEPSLHVIERCSMYVCMYSMYTQEREVFNISEYILLARKLRSLYKVKQICPGEKALVVHFDISWGISCRKKSDSLDVFT